MGQQRFAGHMHIKTFQPHALRKTLTQANFLSDEKHVAQLDSLFLYIEHVFLLDIPVIILKSKYSNTSLVPWNFKLFALAYP